MISGGTPAHDHAMTLASGSRPSAVALAPFIMTIAAAPSVIADALPAVTVPSSRNTGRRRASEAVDVFGRGCSSWTNSVVVGPFPERTVNSSPARRAFAVSAFS